MHKAYQEPQQVTKRPRRHSRTEEVRQEDHTDADNEMEITDRAVGEQHLPALSGGMGGSPPPRNVLGSASDMTGPATYAERQERARARLQRIKARQEQRATNNGPFPKRGQDQSRKDYTGVMKRNNNRFQPPTPFGTAHIGKGPFTQQPYVGLEPGEWHGRVPSTNYDALSTAIAGGGHEQQILQHMSDYMSSNGPVGQAPPGLSEPESQSATALSGILAYAEPHHRRNELGGKPERAALRYAKDHGSKKTFNRKKGAYPPAWAKAAGARQGGTSAWRQMIAGEADIPKDTLDMLDYMSASSGDEG